MKPSLIALTAFAVLAGPAVASAAEVRECDEITQPNFLAEPWSTNSRTFGNGNVRVAIADTNGEPACCSSHLVVIYPDVEDELGGRACKLVSKEGELGFTGIDVPGIRAAYDPARGLTLTVPVSIMREDGASVDRASFRIRLNQATGTLTVVR